MKKIININLSGRALPIEDSAYEKLQSYINSLKNFFSKEESKDEIINDIEARLAEILHEKITKGSACITDADIDEVASLMGHPEDLGAYDELSEEEKIASKNYSVSPEEKKLYRSRGNKILGGVAGGIGAYLGIDPAIIRILFAILTFASFGLGVIFYVLLWIVLPVKDIEDFHGRKLYRSTEEKVLAGVAGGLGAYFGKSPVPIRLAFLAPFVLPILFSLLNVNGFESEIYGRHLWSIGFGSISSISLGIYAVLWIILPKAITPYQKMEMHGEKIDVDRIRRHVKEGAESFKGKVKDWEKEVKETAQEYSEKAKTFAAEAKETGKRTTRTGREIAQEGQSGIAKLVNGIGTVIVVLFKVVFFSIVGVIALSLLVTVLSLTFASISAWPLTSYIFTSTRQEIYLIGTFIFFVAIPVISLMFWVIRKIIGVKSTHNYWGWTFAGFWMIGWIFLMLFASSITNDFKYNDSVSVPIEIKQPATNKLTVSVSDPRLEYSNGYWWLHDTEGGWSLDEDSVGLSYYKFLIQPSADSLYHCSIRKSSYGKTREDARARAEKIQFTATPLDSVLDLSSGFSIASSEKYRGQDVEVVIFVPVGKKLRFDESVLERLGSIRSSSIRHYKYGPFQLKRRPRQTIYNYPAGQDLIMSDKRTLLDSTGSVIQDISYESGDIID
jgi:phage shock protein PspC (stress-responsive transcriptional regulator)